MQLQFKLGKIIFVSAIMINGYNLLFDSFY